MSFAIGESVGPYRIVEQLGQGGMATVYKAYHAALDRYVALKVLHPAFNEDQSFTARFDREARVVAKLDHPHIVPIYDYANHDNRPYLVMKFIDGETLKARFSRGPLTSEEINRVVEAVGTALAYAHKQGILHRDIKPSNVLIGSDNVMYLADFGLARIAQAGESTLSSDSIMGTPQYISPEQAMGKKDLDEGTDIYSFGVMLYELVVGQVPYNADTPFSIIHDHIYSPLPLPTDINPSVPETVQRVLLKALAKERKDRYETIAALVKAFREAWAAAGVPMQGTRITVPPSTLKKAAKTTEKVAATAPVGATVAAKTPPIAKRRGWMVFVGGLLGLFACLAVLFTFRDSISFYFNPGVSTAQIQNSSPPAEFPTSVTGGGPLSITPLPQDSPEIIAAKSLVQGNPGDPQAHLQLSLALWDAKQFRLALGSMTEAANLAGPENRDFYNNAADQYKAREAWLPASSMYLRAHQTYKPGEAPEAMIDNLRESVYMAAGQVDRAADEPEMLKYFEKIDQIDPLMGFVGRGRQSLYNGQVEQAELELRKAQRYQPDSYEAALLKAEISLKNGDTQNAKNLLGEIFNSLDAPDWVRKMADTLLLTLP